MARWKVVPTAWTTQADAGAAPDPAPAPPPKVAKEPPRALQTILWSETTDETAGEQPNAGRRIQSAFHATGADAGSQTFHLAAAYVDDALAYLDEIVDALRGVDPDVRRQAQAAVMAAGQKLRRAKDMLAPKETPPSEDDA